MKNSSSRRGSALLIVLGMMSFIVVSAVAFSAYMRYARLPSSFLRRTSASRLLVKAALAEAIDKIDRGIGNNPYPGVYLGNSTANNSWTNRVFLGASSLCETEDTVSTLSLEGLAYLPPSCLNDVRYLSRRTPTAMWHKLSFDVGRYAFTAVDVSDCFDVNRLMADIGRDSSDLGRVTLTSALEKDSGGYLVQPDKWDAFMEKYAYGSGNQAPLVSLADLNLAIGQEFSGNELRSLSPFSYYLSGGATALVPKAEDVAGLSIVTDSYFPIASDKDEVDISNGKDQPFAGHRIGKGNDSPIKNDDSADDVINQGTGQFAKFCSPELNEAELVQLYDYLDRDSVPLSLAMPTAERTPMITGVAVVNNEFGLSVSQNTQPVILEDPSAQRDPATGQPRTKLKLTIARLGFTGALEVSAGIVYPFKYAHGANKTFKAQALATVTLVKSGDESKLRLSKRSVAAPLLKDWPSAATLSCVKYGNEEAPVVLTMFAPSPVDISPPAKIQDEEDAVFDDVDLVFNPFDQQFIGKFPASALLGDHPEIGSFRLVERIDAQTGQRVGNPELMTSLRPSNADLTGTVAWDPAATYVPVIQVWFRILDANGETVDLVPASVLDDKSSSDFIGDLGGSRGTPLLRFYGNANEVGLKLDEDIFNYGAKSIALTTRAYLADDPRFNYAPENLTAFGTLNQDLKTAWLANQRSADTEGDIFMMTSDAGYLQSKWEMMALLNTGHLKGDTAALHNGYDGNARSGFQNTPANRAMWNTYTMREIDEHTPFQKIVSGKRGFRVNPYTSDTRVLRAAFANTPLDWWAASTNVSDTVIGKDTIDNRVVLDRADAEKYAFGEKSAYAKVRRDDILKLTTAMKNAFATEGWENVFNEEKYWEDDDRIANVDLGVTLHSVDKKFMRGFWRESLDNRQHLFLVFVRAEPMMMGGGGMGQIPPQLGARAVALVWRDPKSSGLANELHRTRVLFYRQFE